MNIVGELLLLAGIYLGFLTFYVTAGDAMSFIIARVVPGTLAVVSISVAVAEIGLVQ